MTGVGEVAAGGLVPAGGVEAVPLGVGVAAGVAGDASTRGRGEAVGVGVSDAPEAVRGGVPGTVAGGRFAQPAVTAPSRARSATSARTVRSRAGFGGSGGSDPGEGETST